MHLNPRGSLIWPSMAAMLVFIAPVTSNKCPVTLSYLSTSYVSGQNLELACRCKPESVTSVVWYFSRDISNRRAMPLSDRRGNLITDTFSLGGKLSSRFKIELFSLLVFDLDRSDSGFYICGTAAGDFFFAYEVIVQNGNKIRLSFSAFGDQPLPQIAVRSSTIYTTWSSWTSCDRCGMTAEQTRLGLCTVQMDKRRIKKHFNLNNDGVFSCGSTAVPSYLHDAAVGRPPERLVRPCFVPCQKTSARTMIGKFFQKKKLDFQHHVGQAVTGKHIKMVCPGGRPERAVAWDRNNKPLLRSQYGLGVNNSFGIAGEKRSYIDNQNDFHIKRVQRWDSGFYRCWVDGTIAAQLLLGVRNRKHKPRLIADVGSPEVRRALAHFGFVCITLIVVYIILMCGRNWFKCPKIK